MAEQLGGGEGGWHGLCELLHGGAVANNYYNDSTTIIMTPCPPRFAEARVLSSPMHTTQLCKLWGPNSR